MSERVLFAVIGPDDCVSRAGSVLGFEDAPPGAYQVLSPKPRVIALGAPALFLDRARTVREVGLMMRVGGSLVERPPSPAPLVAAGAVEIPPCPLGTVIEVSDLTGREVMAEIETDADGWSELIELPDPGQYMVSVQAPAPHLETRVKVVV